MLLACYVACLLLSHKRMASLQQKELIGGSRAVYLRYLRALIHTKHGALALSRLGLPACLSIAYAHPTALWAHELPVRIGVLGWLFSVLGALGWLMLGWAIYRTSRIAAAAALLLYISSRAGHVAYALNGPGRAEGIFHLALTVTVAVMLMVSAYGSFQYHRQVRLKQTDAENLS